MGVVRACNRPDVHTRRRRRTAGPGLVDRDQPTSRSARCSREGIVGPRGWGRCADRLRGPALRARSGHHRGHPYADDRPQLGDDAVSNAPALPLHPAHRPPRPGRTDVRRPGVRLQPQGHRHARRRRQGLPVHRPGWWRTGCWPSPSCPPAPPTVSCWARPTPTRWRPSRHRFRAGSRRPTRRTALAPFGLAPPLPGDPFASSLVGGLPTPAVGPLVSAGESRCRAHWIAEPARSFRPSAEAPKRRLRCWSKLLVAGSLGGAGLWLFAGGQTQGAGEPSG